jgi:hypothetical protein
MAKKRQHSISPSSPNSLISDNEDEELNNNQIKLLFGNKKNIQHLLQIRETKKLKLKEVIKTFYRFRYLEGNIYAYRLEEYLNKNKVEIYKINYENENNITPTEKKNETKK